MTNESGLLLTDADHEVIARCVAAQPSLYMRGVHEGYYRHSDVADLIDMIGRLAALISPAGEVSGWQLVPVVPTDAMLQGGCAKHKPHQPMSPGRDECPAFPRRRRIWADMLSAAPRGMEG